MKTKTDKINQITLEMVCELMKMDSDTYDEVKTKMLNDQHKTGVIENHLKRLFAYTDSIRPQGTTKAL